MRKQLYFNIFKFYIVLGKGQLVFIIKEVELIEVMILFMFNLKYFLIRFGMVNCLKVCINNKLVDI